MSQPLLQRVAAGEKGAFQECVDRFGGIVWTLARRLSPSASDAEDAVQEIFLDLWKSAGRFDAAKASEVTFVAVIARRRLVDRRRRRQRRPDVQLLPDVPGEPPFEEGRAEVCVEARIAAQAIQELRPDQREVLVLALQGFSHDEIAIMTGMPLGTVKSHVRRGLLRVAGVLRGEPEPRIEERPR